MLAYVVMRSSDVISLDH